MQEEIFRNDPSIGARDFKETATIGVELGNLKGTGQRRWTIASEEDVRRAAGEIVAECELHLLPFIEKYSDLNVLLSTLTEDPKTARLIRSLEHDRKKTIETLWPMLRESSDSH